MTLKLKNYTLLCSILVCSPTIEANDDPVNLYNYSLEQLMNIKVTTASKSEKALLDVAASVTVISKQQIKSSGWRTLSDIINAQAGFFTFSDRLYDFVVSRGNYQSNDPNSRILLLLNGHSVIESFGYFNGQLATVDINHIEKIEIVRGAGSPLYGTNAMFAVINVITEKQSLAESDLSISGEVGSFGHEKLALRADYQLTKGHVSLLANHKNSSKESLVLDEYVGSVHPSQGVTDKNANKQDIKNIFVDFKFEDWQLSGFSSTRNKRVPTGIYGGKLDDNQTFFKDTNQFLELKYKYQWTEKNQFQLRVYYDEYRFKGRFDYIADQDWILGPPYESELNKIDNSSSGFELLFNTHLSENHDLVYGIEYKRYGDIDFIYVSENDPDVLLNERFHFDPKESIRAAFLSYKFQAEQNWSIDIGFRYDDYQSVGSDLSIRGSIDYQINPKNRIKLIYGEAFRAPNSWELNGGFYLQGNSQLTPESNKNYELILSNNLSDNWFWQSSVFQYRVDNNIRQSEDGIQFINGTGVKGKGLESQLSYAHGDLRGQFSYSFARVTDQESDRNISFSAESMLKFSVNKSFTSGVKLNFENLWISKRALANPSQGSLPSFAVSNLFLSNIKPIRNSSLSFGIYNLFNQQYQHPAFLADLASFNINSSHPVFDVPAESRSFVLQYDFEW